MTMQTTTDPPRLERGNADDDVYDGLLARLDSRFNALLGETGDRLFTTDATGLWEAYLAAFPESSRQYHNCHACRQFIERVGGLVVISAAGDTVSAMWTNLDAPAEYEPTIQALYHAVGRARVTGVFLSKLSVWGQPETGPWRHFSVTPPERIRYRGAVQTAGQAIAEKGQDFQQVSRALGEFPLPLLARAVALLAGDDLYRSEKVLGPAKWLHELQASVEGVKGPRRANLIWRAVASAPAGFCHPRSSMLGTLLDDLAAGKDYRDVARAFGAKMQGDRYQRPQAAPTEGAIKQAEKLVEQLGAAGALERRFARLDEVDAIWRAKPVETTEPAGSVFGHLKPKGKVDLGEMTVDRQDITWEKFAAKVLSEAVTIEAWIPVRGNFVATLTAANPEAAPILQWDSLERRNPFSWYCYVQGSSAQQWGLASNNWAEVTAVTLRPHAWHGETRHTHGGDGALFVVKGAVDTQESGNAIFPETLRSEFHGVRAVIEAYSRSAKLGGRAEASACGIAIGKSGNSDAVLRIRTRDGITRQYRIDRWE